MVFLGAPGAGKGTYASRLAPKLKIPTIAAGDLVRAEIKANSDLGKEIQSYNDKGQLVPDEIITKMVLKRLEEPDAKGGFILDGFPRTTTQAESLDASTAINLVVNLDIPEWVLVEKMLGRRLCSQCGTGYNVANIQTDKLDMPPLSPKVEGVCDKCGAKDSLVTRKDDTKEIIEDRMQVYKESTQPLIEYYSSKGKLLNFEVRLGVRDMPRLEEDIAAFARAE